ncbi:hypothetical protein Avbf_03318 [Armadillidium vulgare]|nr:hypothetical protein Avbf_03318 [Armadillidium vulgare]
MGLNKRSRLRSDHSTCRSKTRCFQGKVSLNEHSGLRIREEHEKSFESPKMKGLKRRTENSVKCMIEFFPRLLMKN